MRQVTLDEVYQLASDARQAIWDIASQYGREPKIYLHWSAGRYDTCFDDYHINITGDGSIYVATDDLSEVLNHTWRRNSGAIGISLCCAYGAATNDLGSYAPTADQIEVMAQVIWKVADALWLTIDTDHVMTHGEAADSIDGIYTYSEDDCYGPQYTVERWDLQYLGTEESSYYTSDHSDPVTGGNVLRGKATWYKQQYDSEQNQE